MDADPRMQIPRAGGSGVEERIIDGSEGSSRQCIVGRTGSLAHATHDSRAHGDGELGHPFGRPPRGRGYRAGLGRGREGGARAPPGPQLVVDPSLQRLLGLTRVRGRAGEGRLDARVELAQRGEQLEPHAHARVAAIEVGGVVDERQVQALRELAGLRALEREQRPQPATGEIPHVVGSRLGLGARARVGGPRLELGHRGQAREAGATGQVQEDRLGLIGRGVAEGHERGAVLPRLLAQRGAPSRTGAGGQAGAGREIEASERERQAVLGREAPHQLRLVGRGGSQAVIDVADREPQPLARREQVEQPEQRDRVGPTRARHVHVHRAARAAARGTGGRAQRSEATATRPQRTGDARVARWHGQPPCDSTSRRVTARHPTDPTEDAAPDLSPEPLDTDDLRAIEDDPLVLDARDDLHVLVPGLPSPTFVRLAKRLRDESRLDLLLPHATPEQLSSLLDLDGWVRDRIDIRRARVWLHAIAEHAPLGKPRGSLADLVYAMDPELWTVALAAGTVVLELPPGQDDARDLVEAELGSLRPWETPDGYFVVGVPDDELGLRTLQTIQRVYEDDLDEGRKLCLSIQSLVSAMAEEELLRFRNGRLADLGFGDWEEAMKLFRPLDHRVAAEHEALDFAHLRRASGLERTVRWSGPELLRRVMLRLSPEEHGVRVRELLLLVNEVGSAQRFDPGDEAQAQRSIDQTQSTLSLGLELLGRAAPRGMEVEAFLADRVAAIGLRLVFRVGYGALDKVRKAALLLHRGGRVSLSGAGSLLDRPWGPAIASLVGVYPELPLGGTEAGKGTRPLRSLDDVAKATLYVAQASALSRLCFEGEGYGVDPAWIGRTDEPERIKLGDLVRTAIVHTHLPGSTSAMAPLGADDLAWARMSLVSADGVAERVRRDFAERCAELGIGEHQEALAENLLTRMHVELASLEDDASGKPDLRRVGGFLTIQQVSRWLAMRHGEPSN